MKIVEFTPKHLLPDTIVHAHGIPVTHKASGAPVLGGELTPGKVYVIHLDGKTAKLQPEIARSRKGDAAKRARKLQKIARRKNR